jgi:N6-L-threonylcarbamoyladenine synthase
MGITILGIESSCDDTSAAIVKDGYILSNIISGQEVHKSYGGVVPELASRAHQQNIIPVVDLALKKSGISKDDIDAIAFTRGPGLLGSLLVGTSFAKGFALARSLPLIEVNHLQAHVLAQFIKEEGADKSYPNFPFLCLLVSGGHTEIILVEDYLKMNTIGKTLDDAAGEAFDKCGKIVGLPYPAGPQIDKLAAKGNPKAFHFPKPRIPDLNFSFSGLKTSFLYMVRDELKKDPGFIELNLADLSASLQFTIVDILMDKMLAAVKQTGINEITIAGGVSANSGLRGTLEKRAEEMKWNIYLPEIRFTTDNAAMIAITGYYKYLDKDFTAMDVSPVARFPI